MLGTVSGVVDVRALGVAERAAAIALAAGVDLPDSLALWALAGGRPEVEPAAGQPEELGRLLEAAVEPVDRRRQGVHFTPDALATTIATRALVGFEAPSVGDPACGGGALLLAAGRALVARGEEPTQVVARLWGADIDMLAVATTEAALTIWAGTPPPPGNLAVHDALVDDLRWPAVDVVVGNPPFLTPLGRHAARTTAANARLRRRFGAAVQAYTDIASLFLLRACQLTRSGGRVAMVQPQSVLAARDAARVRSAVSSLGELGDVLAPDRAGFDASVAVCVLVIDIGASTNGTAWSARLAQVHGVPPVDLSSARTLGDEATTTAAFRNEYYGMVAHVAEAQDLPEGRPLLTSGLVDLGHSAWGERPARIGGHRWQRPVLDVAALEGRAADWAARTGGPKLVVATQTNVIEVVVDDGGEWIAGVPLVVVLAPPDRLWPLAAALAAPAVTAWALAQAAGTARTPRSLKITAALLRAVPLPTDLEAWTLGTAAMRSGDLERFVAAMSDAYGTGTDVADWWSRRARRVWSRPSVPR